MSKSTTPHLGDRSQLISYLCGFGLSIFLTVEAYWLVTHHAATGHLLIGLVIIFALAQFVVQLIFFLHLDTESAPRWKLAVTWFMVVIVLILVLGSLWIMNNLNYHMQPSPTEINTYLNNQDGL